MKKLVLVIAFLLFCSTVHAFAIYDWVPVDDPRHGGTGFITLDPLGTGATDSDFTSSTITDFTFTFDNGAPTITFSDVFLVDPLEPPMAVSGVFVWTSALFQDPAVFTDARLTFANASADYSRFRDPYSTVPIPFPQESNSGSWILRSDNGSTPIPEPTTILLLGTGLVGLVGAGIRRRFKKVKE